MALGALFITLLALGGPAAATRPCDYEENKGLPFCDVSLSIPARVKDVVSRISDADAITLLVNTASNVSTPRLDAYQWWNEGLHGVARSPGVSFDGPTPVATSFPQVVNTGATFNRTLPRLVGSVISTEARAFNNLGNAGLTYWAPNINILRSVRLTCRTLVPCSHTPRRCAGTRGGAAARKRPVRPGCGSGGLGGMAGARGPPSPPAGLCSTGEDPYHTASYAREFVRGMQEGDGEDPRYLKVSACCKHFAAYECVAQHPRGRATLDPDPRGRVGAVWRTGAAWTASTSTPRSAPATWPTPTSPPSRPAWRTAALPASCAPSASGWRRGKEKGCVCG